MKRKKSSFSLFLSLFPFPSLFFSLHLSSISFFSLPFLFSFISLYSFSFFLHLSSFSFFLPFLFLHSSLLSFSFSFHLSSFSFSPSISLSSFFLPLFHFLHSSLFSFFLHLCLYIILMNETVFFLGQVTGRDMSVFLGVRLLIGYFCCFLTLHMTISNDYWLFSVYHVHLLTIMIDSVI